jgi:hypothetical protein
VTRHRSIPWRWIILALLIVLSPTSPVLLVAVVVYLFVWRFRLGLADVRGQR